MKKLLASTLLIATSISVSYADFMSMEIDPICSITGTTHTMFPWEISDTSSWEIPKAYDWECDNVPELSTKTKQKIHTMMYDFFEERWYVWPVYWDDIEEEWAYGWDDTLNPTGQDFVNEKFFPAIKRAIIRERASDNPNMRKIAIINMIAKSIWYDYFLKWADSQNYIWLTVAEAEKLAQENGVPFRIGKKDGELYELTEDYFVGRITATIEDWIVVDYSVE